MNKLLYFVILSSLFLINIGFASAVLDPATVPVYYTFDTNDLSGVTMANRGNAGQSTLGDRGNIAFTAGYGGIINQSWYFNGSLTGGPTNTGSWATNNSKMSSTMFRGHDNWSISLWMNMSAADNLTGDYILGSTAASGGYSRAYIYVRVIPAGQDCEGHLQWTMELNNGNNNATQVCQNDTNIFDGEFHNYIFVQNNTANTASGMQYDIYVDGEKVETFMKSGNPANMFSSDYLNGDGATALTNGGWTFGRLDPSNSQRAAVMFDEIAFFNNTVLGIEEAEQMYSNGFGCPYPFVDSAPYCQGATPPTPPVGPIPEFRATASDLYNGTAINLFNLTFSYPYQFTRTSVNGDMNLTAYNDISSTNREINNQSGPVEFNPTGGADLSNVEDGSPGYLNFTVDAADPINWDGTNNRTVVVKFNASTNDPLSGARHQYIWDGLNNFHLFVRNTGSLRARFAGGNNCNMATVGVSTGYHMVAITLDGTNNLILGDADAGASTCSVAIPATAQTGGNFYLGERLALGSTHGLNGTMFEFVIYNRSLSSTELTNIYNNITVSDGILMHIPFIAWNQTTQNLTYQAPQYFNRTYQNINTNVSHNGELIQAIQYFNASTIISNTPVTDFTVNVLSPVAASATNTTPSLNLSAGTYTVQFNKSMFFDENISINVTPLTTQFYSFQVGNAQINLTALDYFNGSAIQTLNGWIANSALGFNQSISTTNGLIQLNLEQTNFTVYLTSPNYQNVTFNTFDIEVTSQYSEFNTTLVPLTIINASDFLNGSRINSFNGSYLGLSTGESGTFSTTTGTVLLPLFNDTYNLSFSTPIYSNAEYSVPVLPAIHNYTAVLFPYPSTVLVTVYDAETGSLIDDRLVTMIVSGTSTQQIVTVNASFYLGNLTADIYSFRLSAANYSDRVYVLTVGSQTSQSLNAYLTTSTDTVTFGVLDDSTDAKVENASIVMQTFVNGSLVVVESKFTDIVGEAEFIYTAGAKYIFTVAKNNYVTKQFSLDPILNPSYTVRLTPSTTLQNTQQGEGWSVAFSPKTFTDGQSYNLTWIIVSPAGVLESYSVRVCAPGGCTASFSGSAANGETLTVPFTITGADFNSRVQVNYTVDTTLAGAVSYSPSYPIVLSTYGNQTWTDKDCPDYGLGTFDCALIGTGIVLVGTGGVAFFGGGLIAAPVAMLLIGFGYVLEFFTLWSIIAPLVLAFVIIIFRGGS